uniref:Uncharacterized protein n=1 Tax=Homalodisca liturata TaxID=320908 RepID=A0A1B6HSJ0_9HEMI
MSQHVLLVLLPLLPFHSLCSTKIFYHSAEEKKDMSILELDRLIIEELTHPKEGGGRKLLKHAFKYFDSLDEIKDLVEEKDPSGFDVLRNISYEGPKWIRTEYDHNLLKTVYKWKKDDFAHLDAIIENTHSMWHSFTFHCFNYTGL